MRTVSRARQRNCLFGATWCNVLHVSANARATVSNPPDTFDLLEIRILEKPGDLKPPDAPPKVDFQAGIFQFVRRPIIGKHIGLASIPLFSPNFSKTASGADLLSEPPSDRRPFVSVPIGTGHPRPPVRQRDHVTGRRHAAGTASENLHEWPVYNPPDVSQPPSAHVPVDRCEMLSMFAHRFRATRDRWSLGG